MGFETFEVIIGLFYFGVIFFTLLAVVGFFTLIVENWLVSAFVVCLYWYFRKSIHKHLKRLWKKRIYSILLVIVTVIAFIVLFLIGIYSAMTRYSDKVYSPDRSYYVQSMEVNGGATTAYQTSVSISDAKYIFSNFGIISARTGNEKTVLFFSGDVDSAKPTWIDNHTLKISYECARLYDDPVIKWRDVKIIFEKECEQ